MNRTTKKWIRIGAILLVLVVSAGLLIKNMNIEPADYTARVESEIAQAEDLVKGVDITKGEYTTKSIEALRAAIEEAQAVLDDPASAYSDKKEAAQNLKAAIDKFIESKGKLGDSQEEQKTREEPSSTSNDSSSEASSSGSESKADANNTASDTGSDTNGGTSANSGTSTNGDTSANSATSTNSGTSTNTGTPSDSNTTKPSTPAAEQKLAETKKEYITAYITIECHNLVGKEIAGDKKPYVPGDGYILPRTAVKVEKGQSVFDALNKICRDRNIHLASRYTPLYGSYYIEGINHLFEFDGGQNSGWMYKVNGWFPNYGCSEYALSGGEEIVWCYTCDLGKDVGDNSMW